MMLDKAALLVRILKRPAGDIVPTCGLSSRPARDWTETEKKTIITSSSAKDGLTRTLAIGGPRKKNNAQVSATNDDPARSPPERPQRR
jgi:hypothetical protein